MNIKKTVKTVAGIMVASGVSMIISNVVKSTTPRSTSKINRICIAIGVLAITGMLTDKVVNFTEKAVDQAAVGVEKAVENGELD